MKKLILATTILALAGANVQTAKAGNNSGWNTAAQVLTGVAAGVVIGNALSGAPGNYSVSYGYNAPVYCPPPPAPVVCAPPVFCAPPVVYVPAPVVVYRPPVYVAPRYVVSAPYGYYAGRGYSRGHYGRW